MNSVLTNMKRTRDSHLVSEQQAKANRLSNYTHKQSGSNNPVIDKLFHRYDYVQFIHTNNRFNSHITNTRILFYSHYGSISNKLPYIWSKFEFLPTEVFSLIKQYLVELQFWLNLSTYSGFDELYHYLCSSELKYGSRSHCPQPKNGQTSSIATKTQGQHSWSHPLHLPK